MGDDNWVDNLYVCVPVCWTKSSSTVDYEVWNSDSAHSESNYYWTTPLQFRKQAAWITLKPVVEKRTRKFLTKSKF